MHGELPDTLADAAGNVNWREVAALFSFRSGLVPMNAANLCPSFDVVANTVFETTRELNKDVSFNYRDRFPNILENARQAIATHLNAASADIALVRNTSEANSIINNGFPLGEGDEVLLWSENHATNNKAWDVRARRARREYLAEHFRLQRQHGPGS
jgi:selenocysteine lyase/cysteine desulfurase